jgi:hypothetical protein
MFRLSNRSHIIELLDVFGVKSIIDEINCKYVRFVMFFQDCRFNEIRHIVRYMQKSDCMILMMVWFHFIFVLFFSV